MTCPLLLRLRVGRALFATTMAAVLAFAAPALAVTVDGTIAASEYGIHINGQNQQGTASSQIWYMTWDATNLYAGITASNTAEAAVLYLDKNPLVPINGGTNADGTLVGFNYDGASFANLQSRADLVIYMKDGYREYRTANGANGWSAATPAFGSYASNAGTREVAIPWSAIGGRPASFAWFGYITSSGGFVYAPVPTENATGAIGTAARYERYYFVSNATPGSETKPFSRNCYVFNSLTDETGFGTIGTWDFTMNSAGRSITRGAGLWTIGGDFRVDAGTVNFGASPDAANVSGNVNIAAAGTVTLSSAIGGDLNVAGNWTNTGSFVPAGRAVGFTGTATQTLTGATAFDYLSLNNPTELQLASAATVNQQFTLTDGKVRTGSNALVIGASGTISGSSSARYVIGNLQKPIKVTAGNASQSFEIGDAGAYTPVALSFAGTALASGSMVASTAAGDHAQIASSGLNPARTANRTWTLQNVDTGFTSLDLTFTFVAADLDAGAGPANFAVRHWNGSAWSPSTVGTRTATSTQARGIAALGEFQLGEVQTWTLSASAGAGGSIAPSGAIVVNDGASQAFAIAPASCYDIADALADGVSQGAIATYTFSNVHASHTIAASFALRGYTIAASAGTGGSISPSGSPAVNCGASQAFTITPTPGYHVSDVVVDGVSQGAVSSYAFVNVAATHTIAASFELNVYTITASAEGGVTISPEGAVSVPHGADLSFSFHADACHYVEAVIIDGAAIAFTSDSSYTFTNVQANHSIFIVSGQVLRRIYLTAGTGGSILPATPPGFDEVSCGQSARYTIVPDAGHHITDVTVDGVSAGAVSSYLFTKVTTNHSLVASFAIDTYTITATAESGVTLTPSGAVSVNHGADLSFSFHADQCHSVEDVIVDGAAISFTSDSSYTFTNVQANHSLSIVASVKLFPVHALAGAGGTIEPSGTVDFQCGSSPTFTITPDPGYAIADVLVDGVSQGAVASVTFAAIHANHTVHAMFSDASPPVVQVIAPNGGEVFGLSQPALLRWSATDNTGVASVDLLLSRTGAAGPYETIAAGEPNSGSYTWTATVPTTTNAWLRIVARDSAGQTAADTSDAAFAIAGPTSAALRTITEFALSPAAPNPARGMTRLTLDLPRSSRVRLDVLDVQGRLVSTLADGEFVAGRHTVEWRPSIGMRPLAAGVYLVRMAVANRTFVQRCLLLP